ncbi:MAG: hypothetical protein RLZZ628_3191 [Bacteroidota bacterium]|jgi:hypothetical protein
MIFRFKFIPVSNRIIILQFYPHIFVNIICLFLFLFKTSAQSTIHGIIVDKKGDPIAFVAVIPDEMVNKGVTTDIDGHFSIEKPTQSLTFRCVGMKNLRLEGNDLKQKLSDKAIWRIVLENSENDIAAVTILAGENPADRIMRLVADHRMQNHPERLNTFQCKTYNKISCLGLPKVDLLKQKYLKKDTLSVINRKITKNLKKLLDNMADHDAFLMETVTERKFRYPNDNFERILLNRASGIPNSTFGALTNLIQPFSFYNDFIQVLDKSFVNPVAPSNTKQYFFNIQDTLYQGVDTIFLIAFRPKKGKVFEGLEGVLHINSRYWAVQQVRAKSANPLNLKVKLDQQYVFVPTARDSGHWFPEQLNFELEYDKYPNPLIGMRVIGRSAISDIAINPALKPADFLPETPLIVESNAHLQPDSAWLSYRKVVPFTLKDRRTYEWLDSFGRKKNFPLVATGFQYLSYGKFPLTDYWNLNLSNCLYINDYEKVRLGIGLTNAVRNDVTRPRFWETNVYAGYGLADKAWKYGGELKFRLMQSRQMALRFRYAQDLREPGTSDVEPEGLVSRKLYASRLDGTEEIGADFTVRIAKRLFTRFSVQKQVLKPNYLYHFIENGMDRTGQFNFTEASFYAKYVFDAPSQTLFDDPQFQNNRYPIVDLIYTKGFKDVFNGQYDYNRFVIAAYQTVLLKRIGKASWRVEAGGTIGKAPFSKLFLLNQGVGIASHFVIDNTFQTLTDKTVWLSDRFANLFYKQEVGNVLYRSKRSAPFLSLIQNVAYGNLSDATAHTNLDFKTPSKWIVETGFRLDNLLIINIMNFSNLGLGAAGFYNWQLQDASKSWYERIYWRIGTRLSL